MTEPIRVAQMMTDMNYGGVEMVVMNYYRHIDRTKVQFDFFALEGSAVPQREEIERLGGRVYIVPKYTHLSAYEKEIIRLFKQNQYKIVHSHMNTLSVFSLWGPKKQAFRTGLRTTTRQPVKERRRRTLLNMRSDRLLKSIQQSCALAHNMQVNGFMEKTQSFRCSTTQSI